jgi:hypothetical protein
MCGASKPPYSLVQFADDANLIVFDESSRFEERVWALTDLANSVAGELDHATNLIKRQIQEPRSQMELRILFDEFRKFSANLRARLEERVAASKLKPEDAEQIMAYLNQRGPDVELLVQEVEQPYTENVEL